jgi:hypothetical protein
MFGLGKKEATVPKSKSYVVKATITKERDKYDISDEWTVIVEGSGFTGQAKESSLARAFESLRELDASSIASYLPRRQISTGKCKPCKSRGLGP